MKLISVPVKDIHASDTPIRDAQVGDLDGLAESMKNLGQMVPVMVQQNGDGYALVYGHRRLIAARQARIKELMALLVPASMSETDALMAAYVENVLRSDMNDLDKGRALKSLQDAGVELSEIMSKIDRKESAVKLLIHLVSEPPSVQRLMESGARALTKDHVKLSRGLAKTDESSRVDLLKSAAKNQLSSEEVGRRVDLIKSAKSEEVKQRIIYAPAGADWVTKKYVRSLDKVTIRGPKVKAVLFDREVQRVLKQIAEAMAWAKSDWPGVLRRKRFSPEAARFAEAKVEALIENLKLFRTALKEAGRD